jgi:general secretion pathway protein I
MTRARRHRSFAVGFSLLEVLVAFMILALAGTMLAGLYSGSLRNASAAEEWSYATLLAQSQLAAAASVAPLAAGSSGGSEDGGHYRWTATVEPFDPPAASDELAAASQTLPYQLFRISVEVNFPGPTGTPRSISLATVRLARKELLQ